MFVARAIVVASLLIAWPARAEDDRCISSHEAGQRSRNDGRLRQARSELEACTSQSCPAPVQEDCAKWREEIAAAIPTIVVQVRDGGVVVRDVSAQVDGEPLPTDGRGVEIDPGEHHFRFQMADGRRVEQRRVVLEGVKNQVIDVALPPEVRAADDKTGSEVPAAFWVTGSIGVVGVATFAILAGVGLSKENKLRDSCAGMCAREDVDVVKNMYIAADIVGAVGIASLIAATTIGVIDIVDDDAGRVSARLYGAGAGLDVRF